MEAAIIRIAVSGMGKDRFAELARLVDPAEVSAEARSDYEAALAVKDGRADYYIGACQTGAGAALGVANAILGSAQVVRLSGAGSVPDATAIKAAVASGKRGFGLARPHIEEVVPVLVRALLDKPVNSG